MSAEHEDSDVVTMWLEQVKQAGHQESFEHIWSRYFVKLVSLARKKLSHSPTHFADEEDVVQSALASFYFRAKEGKFPHLNDRDSLWKLLMVITLNKARALARKEGRRNENLRREFSGENLLKGEPSHELAFEFADQLDRLLELIDDDVARRVAVAKLEGRTNEEIARQVKKSIPTVERKLRLVRGLWAEEIDE